MTVPLRERRRQLLRDEILQAAAALLNEKGYAAMSMDELAGRAGISKPTLYQLFATKEDLLLAAVMHGFDEVEQAVASDPTPRTPLQQLTFILRTVIRMQIEGGALAPRPWSPEVFQIIRQREEVLARLRQIDAAVIELVSAGMRAGEIDARLDPATVARAFFALVNTLHSPFARLVLPLDQAGPDGCQAPPLQPEAAAETLAMIFEQGLRAR
ncbi:TetR/AcrR family transcriptional regulator [Kouleothrix sp.]|uniref:TetR/AcrR family transcriptional regulator n=1 Tax=Kouleothrix sp. TaxID=2779161 RepID=UPI0039190D50